MRKIIVPRLNQEPDQRHLSGDVYRYMSVGKPEVGDLFVMDDKVFGEIIDTNYDEDAGVSQFGVAYYDRARQFTTNDFRQNIFYYDPSNSNNWKT